MDPIPPTPSVRAQRAIELLRSEGFSTAEPVGFDYVLRYREIGKVTRAELVTLGWVHSPAADPLCGLSAHTANVVRGLPHLGLGEAPTKAEIVAALVQAGFRWGKTQTNPRGNPTVICGGRSVRNAGFVAYREVCKWAGWPAAETSPVRATVAYHVKQLRASLREAQADLSPQVARELAPTLDPLLADAKDFRAGRSLRPDANSSRPAPSQVERLFAALGNLRPACDIRVAKTAELVVPAGRKITKTLVRRLLSFGAANLAFTQPEHEPEVSRHASDQHLTCQQQVKAAFASLRRE